MFLLVLDIHSIDCQTTTSPNFFDNCSFLSSTYISNSAVTNQFLLLNRTSIVLTAYYAFISPSTTISTYDLGLIYPFATTNYLVPFPLLFNCTSMMIQSCLLQRLAGSGTLMARDGEPINVPTSSINYTFALNQRGFYLREGQYQLSQCSLDNGQIIADNQTRFSIQIRYEKSQGKNATRLSSFAAKVWKGRNDIDKCEIVISVSFSTGSMPSLFNNHSEEKSIRFFCLGTTCNPTSDTCGSFNLTNCSPTTSTCTCLSSNPSITYLNLTLCADTFNDSGCSIFPKRCITWCNSTSNDLCICPSDTLRIQRNNLYVCELPVNAMNCSANDSIRRCPLGQICLNQQCTNVISSTTNAISTTTNQSNE